MFGKKKKKTLKEKTTKIIQKLKEIKKVFSTHKEKIKKKNVFFSKKYTFFTMYRSQVNYVFHVTHKIKWLQILQRNKAHQKTILFCLLHEKNK